MSFVIIETDAGLTVAQVSSESNPDETAAVNGGVLVDPGPYKSFDDAYDGLLALSRQFRLERD
jgi:hypothetical protein